MTAYKFLLAILLVSGFYPLAAQDASNVLIRGTVIDHEGKVMPGVEIMMLYQHGEKVAIISDGEGHFSLTLSPQDTGLLSVEEEGYISADLKITGEMLASNRISAKVKLSPVHSGGQSSISVIRSRVFKSQQKSQRDKTYRPDRVSASSGVNEKEVLEAGGLNLSAARTRLVDAKKDQIHVYHIKASGTIRDRLEQHQILEDEDDQGDILVGNFNTAAAAEEYLNVHIRQYDPEARVIMIEKRKNNGQ